MGKKLLIFKTKHWASLSLAFILGNIPATAQNTYDQVYNLFQAKCTSCHGSVTKQGQLDLSGAKTTVYAAIVGKDPVNPAAKAKGNKLILPGDPHKSFLLRKCNNGLDPDNDLVKPQEGDIMPTTGALAKNEIELIRQWILFGAKQTGVAVDTAIINKYYRGKGKDLTVKLTPPHPDSGFQIHLGPVFLAPKQETEYHLKYNPTLADTLEVKRLDLNMNKKASHHFLLHKFNIGAEKNVAEGLRPIGLADLISPPPLVCAWQTPFNFQLPKRTAYSWPKGSYLDLDFHYFNTNADSVMITDIRLNVYTQPKKTAEAIMYCNLYHNTDITTPAGTKKTFAKPVTFSNEVPAGTSKMYIYSLSSHTHKYGVDYDIYETQPDGTKGEQLYEGFYNFDYTFNQGSYDWEHPAIRRFYPFRAIDPKTGLIHEAVYHNTGTKPVSFGATTQDEMMLMFMQYTLKDVSTTGIKDQPKANAHRLEVYPNPYSGKTNITYVVNERSKVTAEVYNLLGERISTLVNEVQQAGDYSYSFSAAEAGYPSGIYFVKVTVNGNASTQRMIELK